MPMNADIKAQWVKDLRSGEYKQGKNSLNKGGKFCCLGILCEQAVKAGIIGKREYDYDSPVYYDGNSNVLTAPVIEWAGLPETDSKDNPGNPAVTVEETETSLAELNDGVTGWGPYTFAQLADLIEAQL